MFQIKSFIITYGTQLKYGLMLVLLFSMIIAIRTYINYVSIIDTTDGVDKRSASVQSELDYATNFQSKYLSSEYGHLFLAHDNNSIFRGESIINFKTSTGDDQAAKTTTLSHIPDRREVLEQEKKNLSPSEAWQEFIREKFAN
jgi:hypothetical protein